METVRLFKNVLSTLCFVVAAFLDDIWSPAFISVGVLIALGSLVYEYTIDAKKKIVVGKVVSVEPRDDGPACLTIFFEIDDIGYNIYEDVPRYEYYREGSNIKILLDDENPAWSCIKKDYALNIVETIMLLIGLITLVIYKIAMR